mgnify:CR=1 FL=1
MKSFPLISIGVPVYNEQDHISEALESLISQDYPRIEIIISDNGSSDNTPNICQQYASNHPSIIYHMHDSNRGPGFNFEFVLSKANGEFFMWASGHDMWENNYVSTCYNALSENQSAVLCYGPARWISHSADSVGQVSGGYDTTGLSIVSRFNMVFWGNMHPVLGLIKSEHLQSCSIINMVGSDLAILSHLCLRGDFAYRSSAIWYRREFRDEKSYADKLKRYKSQEYRLAQSSLSKLLPLARLPIELIKIVLRSNIKIPAKALITLNLLLSLPIRYMAGKFTRD